MLSNGAIVNVILRDLDLLFIGQILNVNISQTMRANTNMLLRLLSILISCHRTAPCEKLYSVTWTYFSRSNISNANIFEMVRASSKVLDTVL